MYTVVPGRRGKTYEIPDAELLRSQAIVNICILRNLPIHPAVHGYSRGRDRFSCLWPHVGAEYILHLDLVQFFHSCHAGMVRQSLEDYGFDATEIDQLVDLCCWQGRLPIGAPTSPALSNVCCRWLDDRLSYFGTYTRYSDQLIISGQRPPDEGLVRKVIRGAGFKVNEDKSWLRKRGRGPLHILGIQVGKTSLRLTPAARRRLRAREHREGQSG